PKEERKALRNRLDGLKIELAGARGLQYMESTLTKALLAAVTSRLNLNDQGLDQVFAERLDDLLPTGLLEIVPALMARYEERNHPAVAETLREITTHIIRGDFEEWRVSHRLSAVQMQDFTDKQVAAWNSPLPSRYYAAAPLADVDRKAAQLKAVRQILRNAREHIEESIAAEVAKFSEFQRIVDDIVRLEAISPEAFSEDAILQAGGKIAQALDLVGLQQARTDILQLSRVFEQSGFSKIEVYEVTDAIGLLKLGTEPQETCQSWRRGAYNECLLAYVADTNKRAIAIRDEAGQALLRGVIKSTRARDKGDFSGKTMKPIIFCEKPYFVSGDSLTMRAYFEFALEKARLVGAPVVLGFNLSSEVQRILIEEAAKVGLRVSEQRTMSIHIPPSMNEFEYE
ncbi:MAG: hypothetical protein EBZ48_16915, partial [Proteobacteria bacterium]|nr:hypothetical protein [Pseudomonadota bacterium]